MKQRDEKAIHMNTLSSNFSHARRDFIKLCGAATVGGVSNFMVPQTSEASHSLELLKTKASQDPIDELFWSFVRLQFVLEPGLIHMNTGTEGSMPRCIISRIGKYFKEFTQNPWVAMQTERYLATMDATSTKVAEFLGAERDEIVMTTNTTEGLGFTANGLDLQEGDEVLTSLHFLPYNCCWYLLRDRRNITLTEIALPTPAENKDEIIAAFEDAITSHTKVMSFCHINYTTGLQMPVKELCQLARDHGIITVIDGAHGIGMLDFNLHELGCDFYATSPHKWLCAPPGTGVLYMKKEVQDLLWPTVTESYPTFKGCGVFQIRGQQCTPVYACVSDAIDFQNTIGKERIHDRVMALSSYLKEKIIESWGEEKLFSPTDEELSSGLVSFNPFDDPYDSKKTSEVYRKLLDDHTIVIRTTCFKDTRSDTQSKRALRISTHIYNNYRQIDRVLELIKTIIADL